MTEEIELPNKKKTKQTQNIRKNGNLQILGNIGKRTIKQEKIKEKKN